MQWIMPLISSVNSKGAQYIYPNESYRLSLDITVSFMVASTLAKLHKQTQGIQCPTVLCVLAKDGEGTQSFA